MDAYGGSEWTWINCLWQGKPDRDDPHEGLSIERCDGELQDRCKGDPEKIRNVCIHNPSEMWPDAKERPDEREENEENVERGEEIIFEPKLYRCKRGIKNEIE